MTARRLHMTMRYDPTSRRVTVTYRRLWGYDDGIAPVIRLILDQPPGVSWWWSMTRLAQHAVEVPVPDDFEALSSTERYELLRGVVMARYEAQAGVRDTYHPQRRKG